MSGKTWKNVRSRGRWYQQEERPYDKCPHCGEYQFHRYRVQKMVGSYILQFFFGDDYKPGEETVQSGQKCHNCRYKE